MNNGRHIVILFVALLLAGSCIEPIDFKGENLNYLVVDGYITDEKKRHEVKLYRSSGYGDEFNKPEEDAEVMITDDVGHSIPLIYTGDNGKYTTKLDFQGLPGRTYKLHVTTSDDKEYTSSPQKLQQSGSLDSIYYRLEEIEYLNEDGNIAFDQVIQYYLDYTLPEERAYFMWRWDGTYIFPTYADPPEPGVPAECYVKEGNNHYLVLNSSEVNNKQVVNYPFMPVRPGLPYKINYSFHVIQYTISEDSYIFYNGIKEQQENTGSIFDPAPSNIIGNIKNMNNPDEVVLGHFGAFGSEDMRIFLSLEELPQVQGEGVCQELNPPPSCQDCRKMAFSSEEKPDFWQ